MTCGVRGYWVFGGSLRGPRRTRRSCGPGGSRRSGWFGGAAALSRLVGAVLLLADRQGADAGGLRDDVGDADPALVFHRPAPAGPGPRRSVEAATGSRAVVLVRHSVSFRTQVFMAVFPRGK
ncbi:hypothetical protein CF165_04340 [Amycolatopsis vastitatis]|uniref:Uncharacterized protein n=1 Tax=Amycolatopsis vastitatis TaxID=1905142 RepID=A0A229TGE9_9PSEU|nr:hypothetical protein CF165_04340 [Amycolatopsis vastitatis]